MATNFPTSLDSLTNPTATDTLDSPPHDTQHADANDAIEALQAKVGADSSAVTTSHDYKIADHASRITTLEAASTGKILQVVRATDTTNRSTTSTSPVDTGLNVTITPTSATSSIMLVWNNYYVAAGGSNSYGLAAITDNSNNYISGAEGPAVGHSVGGTSYASMMLIAHDSPSTTSATTYKTRYWAPGSGTTVALNNATITAEFYAIEVAP